MSTYMVFLKKSFQQKFFYRSNSYIYLVSTLIRLLVTMSVWAALFASQEQVAGIRFEDMVNYIVISMVILSLTRTEMGLRIAHKVADGTIAGDFTRPVNFRWYNFAEELGQNLFHTLFNTLPICLLAAWLWDFRLPDDAFYLLLFGLSLTIGIILIYYINYIFGLISFWTKTPHPTSWFLAAGIELFGGTMVPIWFYPDFLSTLTLLLPFHLIFFEPINIFLGKISYAEACNVIFFQLIWLAILIAIERWLWHRAQNTIVVQGG